MTEYNGKQILKIYSALDINGNKILKLFYTDMTNYYNAGINGWNYSIGFNTRLDMWVICGYQIPKNVLAAASEVVKMTQKEAFLHI